MTETARLPVLNTRRENNPRTSIGPTFDPNARQPQPTPVGRARNLAAYTIGKNVPTAATNARMTGWRTMQATGSIHATYHGNT